MLRTTHILIATLALGMLPCLAEESTVTVTVSGPTIVGFFPPVTQKEIDEDDGGLREGTAHVTFALEDIEKCLAPRKLTVSLEFTRSLLVTDGHKSTKIDFPSDWEHAVGIVLISPGKAPMTVFATAGPSSLLETGPQAAWKYFSEPSCKRYEE